MKFEALLRLVDNEPAFTTGLLLAGAVNPNQIRQQLVRWVQDGRLYQLRRGLYALSPPYTGVTPHPFLIANRLRSGSYVSCESALSHYGLIPEDVPVTVSVTTRHPVRWTTPLGVFDFRHVKRDLFHGYEWLDVGRSQRAAVATPEKALLDLVHLHSGSDRPDYLEELRLQNLDALDVSRLQKLARESEKAKLQRAVDAIAALVDRERSSYEAL